MRTLEIIRNAGGLENLSEEWNALATQSRTPLLGYDWFASCADAFYTDGDLRVAVVRAAGVLDAVAPLGFERTPFGRRLTILGASQLHEPSDWLFRSTDALQHLVEGVMKLRRPLILQRIPTDSPLCQLLPTLARRAVTTTRKVASSLAVRTRGTWDEYYQGLSSRVTRNIARVRRNAERTYGSVTIERQAPAPETVDGLLERLMAVEHSGWKGTGGSSLYQRPMLRTFFRQYALRTAARRMLRVATLWFGTTPAAVEFSVEAGNRLWQMKIGYQEALAAYSPGLQLTQASIRSAFESGMDAYEFLGTAEPWEARWQPEEHAYRLLLVYPLNVSGIVGACRDVTGTALRRAHAVLSAETVDLRA